ncbi:MAG: hypothetical protein UY53_C0012G0001, partial [Parcubacteria group bacterium GW2011_GWA2_50_10]
GKKASCTGKRHECCGSSSWRRRGENTYWVKVPENPLGETYAGSEDAQGKKMDQHFYFGEKKEEKEEIRTLLRQEP